MELLVGVGLVVFLFGRRRRKRKTTTDSLGVLLEAQPVRAGPKLGRWKVGDRWL